MRKKWFVLAPLILAFFVFVGGEVVMQLWNWLAPALFGWREVTFWQALGLLALCRILFGGHGGHGWRGRRSRGGIEDREKFREALRRRCGGAPQAPENAV